MSEIPHSVLSEHFQERMQSRRLRSAVFLTYQFDPGFFEQEVLPVFIDIPISHASVIRLVQLEDGLRGLSGQLAVYYDVNGLVPGDAGSAKLDIRRVPVRHPNGIFHPKNVFLLVEDVEPNEDGHHPQALIIASLSANLTRSGWWQNVEACHVEEIAEGEKTRLKEDVVGFLQALKQKTKGEAEHVALQDILAFFRYTEQRQKKVSSGVLQTHFYAGKESLPDFLERVAGRALRGAYLEIISPYFDDASECTPLDNLIARFEPKETRVFLPRSAAGEALCRKQLFESVRNLPGVKWGHLPKDLIRLGRGEDAGERFVHAKLYRFFTQNPKREICFVGSANLTSAAHQSGGNVETGFLVESEPLRRPVFWMTPDEHEPTEFHLRPEEDAPAASGGTSLNLRYHWDQARAEVYWDSRGVSPTLTIEARGTTIGVIEQLPPRIWTDLTREMSQLVRDALESTSLFSVAGETEEPALLLVQEEGMSHKPSLLLRLSAVDILRYWSLLTPEQRAAFIDDRAPEIALMGQGADLVTRARIAFENDTVFDRFAGFFHGFGRLERAVRTALELNNTKETNYRLFGKKYDSLGSLLDRVRADDSALDPVDRYVITMCAKQLCQEIAQSYPDYWAESKADTEALDAQFAALAILREELTKKNGEGFGDFLVWFDRWFLKRAEPVQVDCEVDA